MYLFSTLCKNRNGGNHMKYLASLFGIILITSCASLNPYNQYYNQYTQEYYPPTVGAEVRTVSADDYVDEIMQLMTEGYEQIGESAFNGSMFDRSLAKQHGEEIGAEIIVVTQQFTDTNTYTSSVVSYGFGVAPVTSTQRRFDQNASYFAKRIKPLKFGVHYDALTSEEKQKNETNYGLKVRVVVNNSRMFDAGVIPGDIMLEMNGRKLTTLQDFYDDGDINTLKMLRNMKPFEVTIDLSK
jgi:hypothetical protein